ncbi:MAG: family hydrolase [Bacteroidetes bacterium]|jgi:putative hydrolase of the HAD superfamily|nr:family hydrolase [Bacteroidota bacterium]
MQGIKNIIFDLGGVLLNLDYGLTRKQFEQLGVGNFDAIYSQAQQEQLFDLYETGKIGNTEFIKGLKKLLPENTAEGSIIDAWNAMLLDFPENNLHLLRELKSRYRIFLLSNTNELHIQGFEKIIAEQHCLAGLGSLFEQTYYSSRIGYRKPDAAIFEYVLEQNGLDKKETLFFDDSIQHIEGASGVGIKAIFVKKPLSITDFFDASYNLIEP